MHRPTIIYCYDAYCGWCYGFSGVMTRLFNEYRDRFDFEVLSGGMIPKDSAQHIGRVAGYIRDAYKQVEELTGVRFGEDYLWHIHNPELSDWFPHSEKPAVAMAVFRDYHPHETVLFASDLQHALYAEGRDLTDDEAYRHLLAKYDIPAEDFYRLLHSEEYMDRAKHDFALVKQLQVTGFPALLLQADESRFYLLAKGYTGQESVSQRMDRVLSEISLP